MSNKSPEQLEADRKATKAELKIARAKKMMGMKDVTNEIYKFIYKTYLDNKIPVDHFGHFNSKGGETVADRVNPAFSDIDYILAKVVSNGDKLDKLLGKRGGKQSQ